MTGLLIGGLRSPCPNATYVMNDSQDNMGIYLATYDGIFENEQEKEMFHIESIRKMTVCNRTGRLVN